MNSGILFRYFTGSKVTFALIQYFFKAEQLVSNCFDIFIVNFEQKRSVLKDLVVFTGKHMRWSLFLIKLYASRLKSTSGLKFNVIGVVLMSDVL